MITWEGFALCWFLFTLPNWSSRLLKANHYHTLFTWNQIAVNHVSHRETDWTHQQGKVTERGGKVGLLVNKDKGSNLTFNKSFYLEPILHDKKLTELKAYPNEQKNRATYHKLTTLLLSGMLRLHVLLPSLLRTKLPRAYMTNKTQTFMLIHVLCIMAYFIEPFPALITIKGVLSRVNLHVTIERSFTSECFVTSVTWKRLHLLFIPKCGSVSRPGQMWLRSNNLKYIQNIATINSCSIFL